MRSLRVALPGHRRRARARAGALREQIARHGADADRVRALGDALVDAGDALAAIDALGDANRLRPDARIERRLVRLRRAAYAQLDRSPAQVWSPLIDDAGLAPTEGPPVVTRDQLTAGLLAWGILRRGCVLVRGLVPPGRVECLRDAIERAFDARAARLSGRPYVDAAWYDPVERVPRDASREWVRRGQGVLAADAPRAFFAFLETVREIGLDRLIRDYFGERPALSVEKTTLRRADAALHASMWHQDGAFLGPAIRTVDAWFALSRCGRDAPGLDVVPLRLDRVLPTGEPGTFFPWTVAPETLERELPGAPIWRPEFEPGDALLFDHLLLHRTAADPGMSGVRYAIESWFFAPSVYPLTSTPLVV